MAARTGRKIWRTCGEISFFALFVLAPLPTALLADGGDLYIGGGPSFSFLDPDSTVPAFTADEDTDVGGKVFIGYDFTNLFSFEGFYGIPGSAEITSGGASAGEIDYDAAYGLRLVLTFPDNVEGFNVFVKGGASGADVGSTNVPFREVDDIGASGGAGFGYEFGRGWGLQLEYDYLYEDVQMITLGLSKRFGLFGREEEVAEPGPQEPRLEAVETTLGDEDEDGVPDNVDRCSGTPAGTTVDEIGCEAPSSIEILENVRGLFAVGSARITSQGIRNLRVFVQHLNRDYGQLNAIAVEGHTDSSGSEAHNLELARRRAQIVRLVLQYAGVDPAIITTQGYGESRPIADNATAEGRARNRRVEIRVKASRKAR
ncbi:MAG: OmpA family protein [Gammaproteobacteria bacterium]